MPSHIKRISMLAAFASLMLVAAEDAQAQCSRGGRGGGSPGETSLATGSFTPLVSLATSGNTFASQRQLAYQQQQMLAMRQQLMAQQQQLAAMRQQQMQRVAQARYDQQQNIQAMRLTRAEAKRAKRAERIAALKAKRAAQLESDESGVMLASTFRETNPLE